MVRYMNKDKVISVSNFRQTINFYKINQFGFRKKFPRKKAPRERSGVGLGLG